LLPSIPITTDQQQQGGQAQMFEEHHAPMHEHPEIFQDNTASLRHAWQTLPPLQAQQKQRHQEPQQLQRDIVQPSGLADQAAMAFSNFDKHQAKELSQAVLRQWIEAAKEGETPLLAKMLEAAA